MQLIAGSVPDYIEAANRFDSIKDTALATQEALEGANTENAVGFQLAGWTDTAVESLDGNKDAYAALGYSEESVK